MSRNPEEFATFENQPFKPMNDEDFVHRLAEVTKEIRTEEKEFQNVTFKFDVPSAGKKTRRTASYKIDLNGSSNFELRVTFKGCTYTIYYHSVFAASESDITICLVTKFPSGDWLDLNAPMARTIIRKAMPALLKKVRKFIDEHDAEAP